MSRNTRTKKSLYILVEGKTELAYVQDFAKCNPAVKVIVLIETSSRPRLIKEALKFSGENKLDTWIIFDQDGRTAEAKEIYTQVEAFNRSNKAKIHIAYLAPCFEIWPLIHFRHNNIPHVAREVQKTLGQYIKYDHSKHPFIEIYKLEMGYNKAVEIAKKWETSLVDMPEYEAHLFAGIYKLTEFIKNQ